MSQQVEPSTGAIRTAVRPSGFWPSSSAKRLWERWKRVARKIGDFQARVLLMIFYIFIVGPFALLIRWRGDPMGIKARAPRGWLPYSGRPGDPIERAKQQF